MSAGFRSTTSFRRRRSRTSLPARSKRSSTGQRIQHALQVIGQWRTEAVRAFPDRKLEPRRMQEQALQPLLAHRAIELAIAVLLVARDRMSDVCRMHADLVRAPGLDRDLGERRRREPLDFGE